MKKITRLLKKRISDRFARAFNGNPELEEVAFAIVMWAKTNGYAEADLNNALEAAWRALDNE
jgi:hypothetical protein